MDWLIYADLDRMCVRIARWINTQTNIEKMIQGYDLIDECAKFQYELATRIKR